jgi:preprotein translocase subunit Sec61beta
LTDVTVETRRLVTRFRTRRSAAIAGILFGVLLLAAMIMLRIALSEGSLQALQADAQRRTLIRVSLHLVPFAGIAFLWFIGVVREQLGEIEDRLFSTVFMGSGLLFLAMLFTGAATSASLMAMLARAEVNADVFVYGRETAQSLFSVYAMRMAAVFTISVSTVGLRTSSMPRWVSYIGYLVALILLVAAGEHKWTQLLFPAWVLLVSVVILLTRPPSRDGEEPV